MIDVLAKDKDIHSFLEYDAGRKLDAWGPGAHAGTFRGNQLAMKAGTILLKRVSKPEFLADVVRKGKILEERLRALKEKVSIIGDIRAKGLMIGTEFINPEAKPDMLGSYPPGGEIAVKVQRKCFENKLILERGGREGAVTRCLCALNVTDAEIEQAAAIFEKAVMEVDADVKR